MGELIDIEQHRARRRRGGPSHASVVSSARATPACVYFFDLASPFSYLAAERVETVFGSVEWVPAWAPRLASTVQMDSRRRESLETVAERRALTLRLGLVWPDSWPAPVPAAMRAAAHAVESGRGAAFVLAAGRLAFCGGFDLQEPVTLAEAAAAAGLDVDGVLHAALDPGRDAAIERAGQSLLAAGADRLPVVEVAGLRYCGEERLEEAAAVRGAALVH